jgi:hypothetical protein
LILQGITEQPVDTNGNGLFDFLNVNVRIDTLRLGFYTWSGVLKDLDFIILGVASGQGNLNAGVNTLTFNFNGTNIGKSGLDGPYMVSDIAVYGPPAAAAVADEVGRTTAYAVSAFEGFTGAVKIDIKPDSDHNPINPRSRGVIPVAILTIPTFKATDVVPGTVRFGRAGTEAEPAQYAVEDVDGDGDLDMIFHFRTQQTTIQCGDKQAILTGKTSSGKFVKGSDLINTVGCGGSPDKK